METGRISHIQHYSTKDGPGIRTTVFLTGCNLRCLWCANPEAMLPGKKTFYYKERCQKCGACVGMADNHSVRLEIDGCTINRERCTNISALAEVCSYDAYENHGEELDSETLYQRLLRDEPFYRTSNGGVTFSGGEPTLQAKFVYETVLKLKASHISTALDTAGYFQYSDMAHLLEAVDLVLYDIKAYDSAMHRYCTGQDNQLILQNALTLAKHQIPMRIRMILVPGVNDGWSDVKQRIDFVYSLGEAVKQVDLLEYHRLALGKYQALGISYPLMETPAASEETMKQAYAYCLEKGLTVTIGG